jgi:hypothetical protein
MGAKIFLVGSDDSLSEVEESHYESEDVLQALLARYPNLLAGAEMNPDAPRRWLLVSREMPVPDEDGGCGRWSLDHLFLDQDGTPTFVECKRATDTRARREVVAQMLDYAANGTRYWSLDAIRQAAAELAREAGTSLDDAIRKLTLAGPDEPVDVFWKTVDKKLRSGEVRLVFVADVVPPELKRLVEFLSEHMHTVEVVALEVKQYLGQGQKVLVPRLVGRTEAAAMQQERTSSGRRMDRSRFLAACTPVAAELFMFFLDEAARRGHHILWGTSGFSAGAFFPGPSDRWSFAYGFPPDDFQFYFQDGAPWSGPTEAPSLRKDLLSTGLFREAGRLTLKSRVDEATSKRAHEVARAIFDHVEEVIRRALQK